MEKGKGTNGGGTMRNKKKMGWHRPLGAKGAIGAGRKEYGLMQKERQRGRK